jgi:malonyl-CoA/methylmalonyl-CoA synthetase
VRNNQFAMLIFQKAQDFPSNVAIVDHGVNYTYGQLLDQSASIATLLLEHPVNSSNQFAFMVNPGFDYVAVQWGIWRAGAMAVPLCLTYPLPSLQYVLEDAQVSKVVVSPEYAPLLCEYCEENHIVLHVLGDSSFPEMVELPIVTAEHPALMLYTSGTTSNPKGVVLTHANLKAQVETLIAAWQWTSKDHILSVLPLHHVHGVVNVVGCALYIGARLTFLPQFSPEAVFRIFREDGLSLFMAVPTIYYKLIAHWETLPQPEQSKLTAAMKNFRLMVCGSAALPVTTMEKWKTISGHTLLERYGMTEIGMAISNPYVGERRAGYIGQPLPGVEVRLVDEAFQPVLAGEMGEIHVRGRNVFSRYWRRPEQTEEAFTPDGWFKTGDMAVVEEGYYRITGRNSVDIIKSGGYKLSALEIEEVLRTYTGIADIAVVGIPDEEWGEKVVAAITVSQAIDLELLNTWIRGQMAAYKTPKKYLIVNELPRNAMGKVVKNEVKKLFNPK